MIFTRLPTEKLIVILKHARLEAIYPLSETFFSTINGAENISA